MKFVKMIAAVLVLSAMGMTAANADVYVHGYTRSNGTYVQPHMRSDANGYTGDNWSHVGNTNPYTGEAGHSYY